MSLSTVLDDIHRYTVAEYQRRVYLSNGWSSVRRWDGRTAALELAGIEGPSTVANSWTGARVGSAGVSTVGVHRFRYRYQDSRTGFVSNPSAELDLVVSAGGENLGFTIGTTAPGEIIRSTDSKVDRIILEATTAGSTVFFEVAVVDQTLASVTYNLSDDALAVKILPYQETGHGPPPVASVIQSHRERLWLFGSVVHSEGLIAVTNGSKTVTGTGVQWSQEALGSATGEADAAYLLRVADAEASNQIDYAGGPLSLTLVENYPGTTQSGVAYEIYSRSNVIWVSSPGYPEGFQPFDFVPGPSGARSGDLTAGIGFGPVMLFFTSNGMYRLGWDTDPVNDGVFTPVSTTRGALSQRVVLDVEGKVYSMDRHGIHVWSGVFPKHVSDPVEKLLGSLDYSKAARFHCAFYPDVRSIRWYVVVQGEDWPKDYVELDVDSGAWATGTSDVGISESRLVRTSDGLRVYLGDVNGRVWEAESGHSDGGLIRYERLTVAASATTTVVPVDEALPTTGDGLNGLAVFHVESGTVALITSHTATTLTLASALGSAPADGDRLWVGRIAGVLKTRAFSSENLAAVQRWRYLHVAFEPTRSDGRAQVRFYRDLQSQARADYGVARADLPGLIHPGNSDSILGSQSDSWVLKTEKSDGYVRVPLGGEFLRELTVELDLEEPGLDLLVVGLMVDGEGVERGSD